MATDGENDLDVLWRVLESMPARQRASLERRLSKELQAQGKPLPSWMTEAHAQAAHAQALHQQSVASNKGSSGRTPRATSKTRPSLAAGATPAQVAQAYGISPLPGSGSSDGQTVDAELAEAMAAAQSQGQVIPGVPTIEQQMAMQTANAPQERPVTAMPPGAPLTVTPGLTEISGPRTYEYEPGINISLQPRAPERTTFAQLRAMSALWDAIALCEQVWFDIIGRLELKVGWQENIIPDGESESDPKWRAVTEPVEEFFAMPDRQHPLQDWMCMSVKDVLELGQSAIYFQRDRVGRVHALDVIDAATMKVLVDARGKLPEPPYSAFEQIIFGQPAGQWTTEQIYLMRETARSNSPFPESRVERILMRANQALRKQNLDLTRYTSGSVPDGMLFPDPEARWTPEDLKTYERHINGLLAGNDRQRVAVKVGPPGASFMPTRPADPQIPFDRFLINIAVGEFGLTMDEIGMTDTSNRSVGDSQENVIYRRVVMPLALRYARLFTRITRTQFDPRLKVSFAGFEEPEDAERKVNTLAVGVKYGALSVTRMAKMMGWPVDVEVPPAFWTPTGPIFLEDALLLREKQLDAKLAGLEFAISTPAGTGAPSDGSSGNGQQSDSGDDADDQAKAASQDKGAAGAGGKGSGSGKGGSSGSGGKSAAGTGAGAQSKAVPGKGAGTAGKGGKSASKGAAAEKAPQGDDAAGSGPQSGKAKPKRLAGIDGAAALDDDLFAARSAAEGEGESELVSSDPDPLFLHAEYQRWYRVAMKAIRSGQRPPHFASEIIPLEDYALLARDLAHAISPAQVRTAFAAARAREEQPTPKRRLTSHEAAHLATLPPRAKRAQAKLSTEATAIFDQILAEAKARGEHNPPA